MTPLAARAGNSTRGVDERWADLGHRDVSPYEKWVKPVLDRLGGLIGVVLLAPLIAGVAAVVRLRLGRPVILKQKRVGQHGRVFPVYKFRTMRHDSRQAQRPFIGRDRRITHESAEDPRHTPLGSFLRRWSLDELPQLVNVLRGQMSLVGPRPELVEVVAKYEPWQHLRHLVKPGLAGVWQLEARTEGPMYRATEFDLEYVDRLSFRTDLGILARTLPALVGQQRGA